MKYLIIIPTLCLLVFLVAACVGAPATPQITPTPTLTLQAALHPVSASSNAVLLTPLEDGVYSMVALDWDTGKELGKIVLGPNPIFNTAGGVFIPISYTFHTMNVSTFTNLMTFIPSLPIRIFAMGEREDISFPQATSSQTITIVFDWVIRIIAILGAIVLLAPIDSNAGTIVIFIGVIVSGMLLLVHRIDKIISWATPLFLRRGLLKEEQVKGMLSGLALGLKEVGTTKKVAVIFLYSLISWSFFIGFYILGLLALNIKPAPEVTLAMVLVAAFLVNPTGPHLPGVFNILLVVPMALVSNVAIEALVTYSLVIYALLLVICLLLGIWAMRQYKLSLSELRERARESIDHIRQTPETGKTNLPEAN